MNGIKVGENAFVDLAEIDFVCPICGKKHSDTNDKICKRIEKNKCGYTSQKCLKCGKKFYVTADYKGDLQSFTLKTKIK